MKKSIIAVFSVSLTAGTLYLTYSQVKAHLIKKLVTSWEAEMKSQNKALTDDQAKYLKDELDKLYIWEVKWLSAYWSKLRAGVPEKELRPYLDKIKNKKICDRVDLKAVDTLRFGT